MKALKYTIIFVKTCNLKMIYLVFGNELNLKNFNFNFQMHYLHIFMTQLLFISVQSTFL